MAAAALKVPRVEWRAVEQYLRAEWRDADRTGEGLHGTIIAPTRGGKTHLALSLLDLRRYAIVLATKRQDPLVAALRGEYEIVRDSLNRIQWTTDSRPEPLTPKVVLWPTVKSGSSIAERKRVQQHALREALNWIDESGRWTVLADEGQWLSDHLRLREDMEALWFQGRTQGVSVIACAQRPVMIPRLAYSQARFLFLGRTGDRGDLERLRDIAAGFPRELIEQTVTALDAEAHEFVFLDAEARLAARVIAPPRLRKAA